MSEGSSVPVVSRWLWSGNRTLLKMDSMVLSWWIVGFFLPSDVMDDTYLSGGGVWQFDIPRRPHHVNFPAGCCG